QPHLILPGQSKRTASAFFVLVQIVVGNAAGALIAHIPKETVETSFRLDLLLRFVVIRVERLVKRLQLLTGIGANYGTGAIEDLDGDQVLGSLFQVIVNYAARRWILAVQHGLGGSVGIRVNAVSGCRGVEVNVVLGHLVGELTQRAHVVQDPERAAVCGNNERSEEHTSELQSRQYLVCRLL